MKADENKLPENKIVETAYNVNVTISNVHSAILVPVYANRSQPANMPNAYISFKLPAGIEVPVTIEIPFKGNISDTNISLDEAAKLMDAAFSSMNSIYGKDVNIQNSMIDGTKIVITGVLRIGE